jgi:2-keto-4-pentenoate hydratase/2-oxohepta-3-ene-1,7-dioic acid hydratase in catechol pathway
MRIVRFAVGRRVRYGLLADKEVRALSGTPYGGRCMQTTDAGYKLEDVRLLAPCTPSKIVAVGRNYAAHAQESGQPIPERPYIFVKPSTAVIGPEDKIIIPHTVERVDYEGELGVVIGRKAKAVGKEEARDYILGYTCLNDVSARTVHYEEGREVVRNDGDNSHAKGYDTFAPIGPWIETKVASDDLLLETVQNGIIRQSARTNALIFPIEKLIEFISWAMTLLPGDVVSTGTPAGIGTMEPGDVIEVKVEEIGTLRNYVVAAR